jgi:polyisoprenoid-binding protein YceI
MATTKWVSDPAHSELQFKVKHMMVSNVTGSFQDFQVDVKTTREDLQDAEIRFSAEVDSIFTGSKQRDEHLKSKDFFEAEKYPQINFVSTSFKKLNDEGDYELIGDLTIHGVSKPVKLQVSYGGLAKDPWGNEKAGFSVTGKVNRKDWGLSYNAALETGGVMVGEEVRIMAELQMAEVAEKVNAEA